MPAPAAPSSTRVEAVRQEIYTDILAMRYAPGERLRMAPLCTRYGVSLSVVREALTRLVEQRIVVSRPQLGFTVVPVDRQRLEELTELRAEIEALALRWSIQRGGPEWEAGVTAALDDLLTTPHADPTTEPERFQNWALAHAAFHRALAAGCGNRQLIDTREILFGASELFRRWSREAHDEGVRDVEAEHSRLAEAALARSEEEAVGLLLEHIRITAERLLRTEFAD
jgi:DNA-binding GntR family transcriptional regulator